MAAYKNKVRVAAHRGNSCVCPENTLVAMRSALELPVDMLEIDLHMTKDGHIILMHDLYAATADACEVILPALAAEGYQFVTVSELLEKRDIVPAAGQVYTHATA